MNDADEEFERLIRDWVDGKFQSSKRALFNFPNKLQKEFRKLESISPEVFERILFEGATSPSGWKAEHFRPPSLLTRKLWHLIVSRALATSNHERVGLHRHEFDSQILQDLMSVSLVRNSRHQFSMTRLIDSYVEDSSLCIVSLNGECIAIYAGSKNS